MLSSAVTLLTVLGLTTAAPTLQARQAPSYPPPSQSNAFNLIVNVTDPANDFSPSVNNYIITSYHSGAGSAFAVAVPNKIIGSGRLFYENRTNEKYAPSNVLTDGGQPLFPSGLTIQDSTQFDPTHPDQHDVYINAGAGTTGVGVTTFPVPVATLHGPQLGNFAICNNTLPYGQAFNLVYAYTTTTTDPFELHENIPEGCVKVALIPQCEDLNELPAGSISSHEFASTQTCYNDVAAIDWSVYSAA